MPPRSQGARVRRRPGTWLSFSSTRLTLLFVRLFTLLETLTRPPPSLVSPDRVPTRLSPTRSLPPSLLARQSRVSVQGKSMTGSQLRPRRPSIAPSPSPTPTPSPAPSSNNPPANAGGRGEEVVIEGFMLKKKRKALQGFGRRYFRLSESGAFPRSSSLSLFPARVLHAPQADPWSVSFARENM